MDLTTAVTNGKSNSNYDNRPTQYDYAALYEHWLVQQKHAANNNNSHANANANLAFARALAARAGRMGTIQCAMMQEQQQSQQQAPVFLQTMLERMHVMEDGPGCTRTAGGSGSRSPLPLPDYVTQKSDTGTDSAALGDDNVAVANMVQDNDDDVDVDAFFDEYPECIRPGWNVAPSSDDYDDDYYDYRDGDNSNHEQENDPGEDTRQKKRPMSTKTTQSIKMTDHPIPQQQLPLHPQCQQQQQPSAPAKDGNRSTSCILYSQNSYSGEVLHQQQPFQQQQYGQSHATIMPPPPPPPENQSNITQSWDDHLQGQNPFQTAREYAAAGGDNNSSNNNNGHRYHHHQQQQSSWNNNDNNNNNIRNPYNDKHNQQKQQHQLQEELPNSPMVPAPVIRESLKRKFQPPKRGAVRRENTTSNSTTGASQKQSSKKGETSNSNNSDDDDDDLPEELKRYGKKMVEQIQSEIMHTGEPVTFDDIAGLEDAKETIQEIVCWPMKRPDLFTGLRRTPNGLLLFGPPGTGKTLIGKAIAHESGACFFSISCSSLTSKWIGEGEKLVRTLFAVAAFHQPAVVFIDEIDSLLTQRKSDDNEASRRMKTEFLVQLDGTGTSGQGRVLVIGATNRPQELDEAARRRFVKRLYIPLPDESDRSCLLQVLMKTNANTLTQQDIVKVAGETKGYSGADLKALCADAAMGPIRQLGRKALDTAVQDVPPISFKHFKKALRGMHPSVSPEDIVQYEIFDKTFGSRRASSTLDDDDDDVDDDNDDDDANHDDATKKVSTET